jgi:hypothetical protein
MGIFQYLRKLMGMDTQISEDVVEEASPSVKAPAAKPAAKKPGRPAKAYEKKAKPVGGKKL